MSNSDERMAQIESAVAVGQHVQKEHKEDIDRYISRFVKRLRTLIRHMKKRIF